MDTRELYPADLIDGKMIYHSYTRPEPVPVADEPEPMATIRSTRITKCESCHFLWLESEMRDGICPACVPVSSFQAEPDGAIGAPPATAEQGELFGGGF